MRQGHDQGPGQDNGLGIVGEVEGERAGLDIARRGAQSRARSAIGVISGAAGDGDRD